MPVLCRYASAFSATPRGSRSYGSRVIGSTIVQMRLRVGSALKTSIHAVVGSGITSMSLALMARQPRMLEPSKPRPSVKISSLYSVSVVVKCCQEPGRSVNLKSTSFTSWSLIILVTSEAVLSLAIGVGYRVKKLKRCSGRSLPASTLQPFIASTLDCFLANFFRANPHGVLDREHKNFSIADLARLGGADHDGHRLVHHFVREHDFDFYLREKIHCVLAAAINLGMAFLAPKALHFRDRHALDAELGQGFLHFLEFERLDDRFELFHVGFNGGGCWFSVAQRACRNACALSIPFRRFAARALLATCPNSCNIEMFFREEFCLELGKSLMQRTQRCTKFGDPL